MSAPGDVPGEPRHPLTPAHVVVIVLSILTVVSLLLGIATGAVNESTFRRAPVSTAITIP